MENLNLAKQPEPIGPIINEHLYRILDGPAIALVELVAASKHGKKFTKEELQQSIGWHRQVQPSLHDSKGAPLADDDKRKSEKAATIAERNRWTETLSKFRDFHAQYIRCDHRGLIEEMVRVNKKSPRSKVETDMGMRVNSYHKYRIVKGPESIVVALRFNRVQRRKTSRVSPKFQWLREYSRGIVSERVLGIIIKREELNRKAELAVAEYRASEDELMYELLSISGAIQLGLFDEIDDPLDMLPPGRNDIEEEVDE